MNNKNTKDDIEFHLNTIQVLTGASAEEIENFRKILELIEEDSD
tara:strand:+ start:639 stop:770 length:132 start_codon:yes stop_codon:yes gene_type:complete